MHAKIRRGVAKPRRCRIVEIRRIPADKKAKTAFSPAIKAKKCCLPIYYIVYLLFRSALL